MKNRNHMKLLARLMSLTKSALITGSLLLSVATVAAAAENNNDFNWNFVEADIPVTVISIDTIGTRAVPGGFWIVFPDGVPHYPSTEVHVIGGHQNTCAINFPEQETKLLGIFTPGNDSLVICEIVNSDGSQMAPRQFHGYYLWKRK